MPQGTLIVLDVGSNTLALDENSDKSFFQKSKECITRVIERKIMVPEKELLGIILMGSNNARANSTNSNSDISKNIEISSKLESPSWIMIRSLPDMPMQSRSNWFHALIDAANYFKSTNESYKGNITNKRIILITNFMNPSNVSKSKIEKTIHRLIKENFQVDVIGCNIYTGTCTNPDISLARKIVETTNGVTTSFDDAMKQLRFYKKKYVSGNPWKVDLCIGPNIKIPVSSYIKIKNEKVLNTWKEAVRDPITDKASNSMYVKKNILYHNADHKIVDCKEKVKGYCYSDTVIPTSSLDKRLVYNSGPESLNIYGFTPATNIKWENLNYHNLSYVFGRKGDKKAQYAIKCLAQCLMDKPNLVGIVRGVRRGREKEATNAPRMYALMPVREANNFICLSLVGICFKEEIHYMTFPPIESKKFVCSYEQINGFKNLITAMDLTNDEGQLDDCEKFTTSKVPSPSAQHILDCMVFRAKNLREPLPRPSNDLIKLMQVPPFIKNRAADSLEKLKSLFVLNDAIDKDKNYSLTGNDLELILNNTPETATVTKNIYNIGTLNPISDYILSLSVCKSVNTLAQEMSDAIETLIYSNLDAHQSKAVEAMLFFRAEGIKDDPSYYNKWLRNFKMELVDRKRNNILALIKEKKMDYILNNENRLSQINVEEHESEKSEMDTMSHFVELNVGSEVNELFNNM